MAVSYKHILGTLCIVAGLVVVMIALGDLLLRVLVSLAALSLVNYGLNLRGLPPLQMLVPMMASRRRWF